jgi:hypothetical protein
MLRRYRTCPRPPAAAPVDDLLAAIGAPQLCWLELTLSTQESATELVVVTGSSTGIAARRVRLNIVEADAVSG